MAEGASFLGQGWGFPPTFTQGGADVNMVEGVVDVHQSLQILLATRTGERVMQEGFGCDLNDYLFEEIDNRLVGNLTDLIKTAIMRHEPRVDLDRVDIDQSKDRQGLIMITIDYTVRTTNTRFNMVYPFYINEAYAQGMLS